MMTIRTSILMIVCSVLVIAPSGGQPLNALLETAAKQNPGIQARYTAFEAAMEHVQQVNAIDDPMLTFGYFISPIETRVGPQQARVSLAQKLPWFGTLSSRETASTRRAEALYQEFLNERDRLYLEVSTAYYALYEVRMWRMHEERNRATLGTFKRIAESRYANSQAPMTDVLRADLRIRESQTRIAILERKERPLTIRLNTLLNQELTQEITISDTLSIDVGWDAPSPDSALARTPRAVALERLREASSADQEAARSGGLPSITLGLDYAFIGTRDVAVDRNGADAIMPMVGLNVPLYRSKYSAAEQEAALRQRMYDQQRQQLLLDLSSQYEDASFKVDEQQDLYALYQDQVTETERIMDLLLAAYRTSDEDFEEVLRMQIRLTDYRQQAVSAVAGYFTQRARLLYITSGY